MAELADQHYVPNSYLKPWCDPDAPPKHTPYVWRFAKDGSDPRRKAPKNIFSETDFYTIRGEDGTRDLTLERGLNAVETNYCVVRDRIFAGTILSKEDHAHLCLFVAAMQARTKAQRDHQSKQWGEVFEMMKSMKEQYEAASPGEREALQTLGGSASGGPSLNFNDVKQIVEQPMSSLLGPLIDAIAPELAELDMGLVETDDAQGFITSDSPCVWYDPELVRLPPFYRDPRLSSPTIEVILPVSPHCMLLFNRRGFNSRVRAPEKVVMFYNRLTRFHAHEYFVTNRNATERFWFEEEPLPPYAWENRNQP